MAKAGNLDLSFGPYGMGLVFTTRPPVQEALAYAVVEMSSGGLAAVGYGTPWGAEDEKLPWRGCERFLVARYDEDGSPVKSYGTKGFSFGPLPGWASAAVALDGDRLFVAGSGFELRELEGGLSTYSASQMHFGAAAYTAKGQPDPAFGGGTGWISTSPVPKTLSGGSSSTFIFDVVRVDDQVYAAGTSDFNVTAGTMWFVLLRYAGGKLDASFGSGGLLRVGEGDVRARAIAYQPAKKRLVVVGDGVVEGRVVVAVAGYRLDGTLDNTFGAKATPGLSFTPVGELGASAAGVAIAKDGGLWVVGDRQPPPYPGGPGAPFLAHFSSEGILDSTPMITGTGGAGAVAVDPDDGTVLIAGSATIPALSPARINVWRHLPSGELDTTFIPAATPLGSANAILIQATGKVVVAGSLAGSYLLGLARFETTSSSDSPGIPIRLDVPPRLRPWWVEEPVAGPDDAPLPHNEPYVKPKPPRPPPPPGPIANLRALSWRPFLLGVLTTLVCLSGLRRLLGVRSASRSS